MDSVLKALAEPNRRRILALIRERELSAGAIAGHFGITRPAVSQHLGVLREAGLVTERREGARRWYRSEPKALAGVQVFLDGFEGERLTRLKHAVGGPGATGAERVAVEREVVIPAGPEAIWPLLVEPSEATRWMGRSASFDLRVGGRYRVEVLPGLVAAGSFLEIDPRHRLVHTWGWDLAHAGPVPPGSTIVAIELTGEGARTRLRLCHRELPSIGTAGSHARGWAHYLARLAAVASGRLPGPDPWITDPAGMRSELRPASGGSIEEAGNEKG